MILLNEQARVQQTISMANEFYQNENYAVENI